MSCPPIAARHRGAASQLDSDGLLPEPPISKGYSQGPIKCPCCHVVIEVESVAAWRGHFFRDLRPYACLAQDCRLPDRLYPCRREWAKHMDLAHWRTWICPLGCPSTRFATATDLRLHMTEMHVSSTFSEQDLAALADLSNEADPAKARGACPLCAEAHLMTPKDYQRHVGHHLEQLALFTVSAALYDADGSEDDQDRDGESRDAPESHTTSGLDAIQSVENQEVANYDTDEESSAAFREESTNEWDMFSGFDEDLQRRARLALNIATKEREEEVAATMAEEASKEAMANKAEEEVAWRKQLEKNIYQKATVEATVRVESERAMQEKQALEKELRDKMLAESQPKVENDKEDAKPPRLYLKDAIGRKFAFPFHLCQNWVVSCVITSSYLTMPIPIC